MTIGNIVITDKKRSEDDQMNQSNIIMKRISPESLNSLSRVITEKISDSGAELIFQDLQKGPDTEVLLLVFEKYYLRTGSYTALTVQCTSSGNIQRAAVVGTGGGSGLFNLSFGSNESFAQTAKKILEACGFEEDQ